MAQGAILYSIMGAHLRDAELSIFKQLHYFHNLQPFDWKESSFVWQAIPTSQLRNSILGYYF